MKKILIILLILLISQFVFAQIKIEKIEGDYDDSKRVRKFADVLNEDVENTGFIVIPINKSREGLGNILAFIEGVKSELGKESVKRSSFAMIEGKKPYSKEFWIIPKGKRKPEVKEIKINLDKLKTKYFYATMCVECFNFSPQISSERMDFIPFAEALKKNPNYRVLIVTHSSLLNWANREKNNLVNKFDLNPAQIDVELGKIIGIEHPVYDFYIIPNSKKHKK